MSGAALTETVASVADAAPVPYWLDRSRRIPDHQPLSGGFDCDLLVVGGGFTGLWAAIEASAHRRDVLVVDAGALATGASGRCGGFVNASITHGIVHGHARWPGEMAAIVAIQQALWDDTMALLDTHDRGVIEPSGKLTVATRPHQLAELEEAVAILRRYDQDVALLDADAVRAELDSPTYLGGYRLANANGVCDPVRLAEALAAIATERGVRFAEHTKIERLRDGGAAVTVHTATGAVGRARQVVLATNAYPPLRRRLRSRVIPVYDHVIATAPLTAEQWGSIGWHSRGGVTDAGNQFHYYRPTPTGGVLFGGWDATYHFGGRVDPGLERRPGTHRLLARHLVETFPALEGIEITHAWGGPIDSTSRFTPTFGTAMGGKLGWAVGFTGLGVGSSRFAALAALDLLAGAETERTRLSMVRRAPIPFPPEPLRWPVIQLTKRALAAQDRTGRKGPWLRLLDRIGVGFDT